MSEELLQLILSNQELILKDVADIKKTLQNLIAISILSNKCTRTSLIHSPFYPKVKGVYQS